MKKDGQGNKEGPKVGMGRMDEIGWIVPRGKDAWQWLKARATIKEEN